MRDTTETPDEVLDACWHDQREQDFSMELDHLLKKAADAIDTSNEPGPEGPLVAITRALAVVDEIRAKLISEAAFRGAPTEAVAGLARIECDLAVGLDALGLLIKDHEENELAPTLELILDRFQSCKDRLDSEAQS